MNEHGDGEVSIGKHRDNVRQMRPDCLRNLRIFTVVDRNFDSPTVGVKPEVMTTLIMRESHCLIAVFLHIGIMLPCLFHMLFVHRARLHVLCCQVQPLNRRNAITVLIVFSSSETELLERQTSLLRH
jgi:hypothetical protein